MSGYRVFPTCISPGYAFFSKIPEQTAEFTPHLFNDVYILEYNGGKITIQESEVDGYSWATEDEVLKMIENKEFIQYKPELIRMFFEAYRKGIRNAPDLCIETSYI